jgi:phosphoribosyl-AMP cyclohydrolase
MKQKLLDQVKFDENGLIPAILQDAFTGRVLMLAYMNHASLEKTSPPGIAGFIAAAGRHCGRRVQPLKLSIRAGSSI